MRHPGSVISLVIADIAQEIDGFPIGLWLCFPGIHMVSVALAIAVPQEKCLLGAFVTAPHVELTHQRRFLRHILRQSGLHAVCQKFVSSPLTVVVLFPGGSPLERSAACQAEQNGHSHRRLSNSRPAPDPLEQQGKYHQHHHCHAEGFHRSRNVTADGGHPSVHLVFAGHCDQKSGPRQHGEPHQEQIHSLPSGQFRFPQHKKANQDRCQQKRPEYIPRRPAGWMYIRKP